MTLHDCLTALTATILTVSSGWPSAQAPAAPPPTCMTLLTDAEVIKVLGAIPATQKMRVRPGHTGCMWARQSPLTGLTSLAADFADLEAIKTTPKMTTDSWGETWPITLPRFYHQMLRLESEMTKTPGEALPGLGERATLFQSGNGSLSLVIQRADGVATIRTNVSRSDLLAVARAFVAP